MLNEKIHMSDDQIYRELITTVLHSDTQPDDVTVEELMSQLEKLLAANVNLDPHKFIAEWLRYAL
jgi:hypothetical protein